MKLFDAEIQCDGEEIKIPRNAKLANFCASLAPYHTISLFVWGGGSLCSNYINVYTYNYVFIYIYIFLVFFGEDGGGSQSFVGRFFSCLASPKKGVRKNSEGKFIGCPK